MVAEATTATGESGGRERASRNPGMDSPSHATTATVSGTPATLEPATQGNPAAQVENHTRHQNKNRNGNGNGNTAHATQHMAEWKAVAAIINNSSNAQLRDAWNALDRALARQVTCPGTSQATHPSVPTAAMTQAIRQAVRDEMAEFKAKETPPAQRVPPRSWASIVATGRPAQPASSPPSTPKVVPQRQLRQILIKGQHVAPEFANRSAADTVTAINTIGKKGGAKAANKLPSGDIILTFAEQTRDWHMENRDRWVPQVFGNGQAVATRTYAILAKGVPRAKLADVGAAMTAINTSNAVSIYRAKSKFFKPGSTYGALLMEFTNIHDANRLCMDGIFWNSEYHTCEVYCGDLRPTLCFNCWQYGHKARFCKQRAKCPKCNASKHDDGTPCPAQEGKRPYCCPACKGPHGVLSRACPEGKRQWDEARALYKTRPAYFTTGSGASSTQSPTTHQTQTPAPTPAPAPSPAPTAATSTTTASNPPRHKRMASASPPPPASQHGRHKRGRPSEAAQLTAAANQPGQQLLRQALTRHAPGTTDEPPSSGPC